MRAETCPSVTVLMKVVIKKMCALVSFLCEIVAVDICLLCSILLNRMVPQFVFRLFISGYNKKKTNSSEEFEIPYFPAHKMHRDFFVRNFRKK